MLLRSLNPLTSHSVTIDGQHTPALLVNEHSAPSTRSSLSLSWRSTNARIGITDQGLLFSERDGVIKQLLCLSLRLHALNYRAGERVLNLAQQRASLVLFSLGYHHSQLISTIHHQIPVLALHLRHIIAGLHNRQHFAVWHCRLDVVTTQRLRTIVDCSLLQCSQPSLGHLNLMLDIDAVINRLVELLHLRLKPLTQILPGKPRQ